MDTQLRGKTALITAGSTGIGLAIALELAGEGVDIAVASRNPDAQAVEQIRQKGVRVLALQVDVSQEQQVVEMVGSVIREFGHLDLYVNNAAVALHEPLTRITTENWMRTLNTNLSGCLWGVREASRHMVARGSGGILIVGSTSMYTPGITETAYRTTKTGLKVIMQNAALELAPYGIRVNLLVPGHYRTRLTEGIPPEIEQRLMKEIPLRRFGNLDACGKAAVMLLSDHLSAYTTGAELIIDGGLHLRTINFRNDEELVKLNAQE